jgi:hypothetical protein
VTVLLDGGPLDRSVARMVVRRAEKLRAEEMKAQARLIAHYMSGGDS